MSDDPTERQLIAYNARDVDAFVPCFAKYPALHADIVSRIRVGEFVLHEESVTGRQEEPEHVIAIYRVRSGLIDHVRFIR